MGLKIFKSRSLKRIENILTRSAGIAALSAGILLTTSLSSPASAAKDNSKNPIFRGLIQSPPHSADQFVPDQIIVMPNKGLDKDELDQSIKDIDGKIVDKDFLGLAYLVEVPKGKLEDELKKAAKDKNFRGVQRNLVAHEHLSPPAFGTVPNDPGFSQQFYLSQLDIPNAWALGATGAGIVYGSLDTGVDYNHNPDLEGRTTGLLAGKGYQSYRNLPNGAEEDLSFGHGSMTTNCFGSSTNNGFGFASPCFDAAIVPVSVVGARSNEGNNLGATDFSIGRGIEFMMLNNVRLTNLSFNADPPGTFSDIYVHPLMAQLFGIYAKTGGIVFNSAGNSGIPDGNGVLVPGLIVVSALDPTLNPASFTVWGPAVQFAAPGENIVQTANGGVTYTASGTSFSSPLTAGVAGQIASVNPALSMQQVVQIMRSTAAQPPGGIGARNLQYFYGFGIPDAAAGVRLAQTSY